MRTPSIVSLITSGAEPLCCLTAGRFLTSPPTSTTSLSFFPLLFLLSLRLSRKDGEKSLEGWGGDGKRGNESEPGCFMGVTTEQTHPRKMPTLRFPTIENTQGVDLEIHFSHSANMYYGDESQLITAPTPPNPTLSPLAMPAPLPDPSTSITTPRRFQTLRSPPPPPPSAPCPVIPALLCSPPNGFG